MRQKSKRALRSRYLTLALLVLAALLLVGGLAALVVHLLHYSANTTVSAKDEPQQSQIQPTPADEAESLPINTLVAEGFTRTGDFLHYASSDITSQLGVDVSAHQQDIDWQAVAQSGVEFAILRVGYRGYTEGLIQEDTYFEQNLAGAIEAGLEVGVYFFSQAMDEQEAREEARFVLSKLEGYQLAFPVFFDWEKIGEEARSDAMDLTSLTTVTDTFCTEIENAGYQAGLYFNQQLGYEELHLPSLRQYCFWLAEYNEVPTFPYAFELWQYSCEGRVAGIEGNVDLNLAFFPSTP